MRGRLAGVSHFQRRAPRDPFPGQPVELVLTVGPADGPGGLPALDRAWVYWTTDGSDPQGHGGRAVNGLAAPLEPAGVDWSLLLWGYVQTFRAVIPAQPEGALVRYYLSAGDGQGAEVRADGGAAYAYYVADDPPPAWTRDAVIYQIFVERFSPGEGRRWQQPRYPSGFYGGRIRGITESLEYISRLGVNVLWLTPVFPSPSHHGYDATDLFEIEPRLGTKADLRQLLDQAHARNIRVLLDFVPNHWSSRHATFQDAIANPHSEYRDWYTFTHWPGEYESFFGVKDLPQINLRNPAARQHVLDAAAYWLEFGVDGYRVDYAIGPSPDFWAYFRRATRRVRPDCWTFGEVVEPSDAQITFAGQLDGCLDFLLLEALRQTFAFGRWSPAQFAAFLDRHEAFFPPDFSRPSFLDNHDMNRILWALEGDRRRLRLAALCQFTLTGAPILYYGTEVGLSQERDVRQGGLGLPEESRLPMLWGPDQDPELLMFFRGLIALRNEHAALRRGIRETLSAGEKTLVYRREHEGVSLGVALNLAGEPQQVRLPGLWQGVIFASEPGWEMRQEGGETVLSLPHQTGVVLK